MLELFELFTLPYSWVMFWVSIVSVVFTSDISFKMGGWEGKHIVLYLIQRYLLLRSSKDKIVVMSSYLYPHLMFNYRYFIEFLCLKECLNWQFW